MAELLEVPAVRNGSLSENDDHTMTNSEDLQRPFKKEEPLRIAVIDPSAFTIPYDRHLCSALGQAGHDVILFTRPARQQDYFTSQGNLAADPTNQLFTTDESVYRNTFRWSSTPRFRRAKLAAKAVEHVRNMRRLTARLKKFRPSAIHFQWLVIPAVDVHFVKQLRKLAPVFLTVHDAEAFHAPTSKLQRFGWAGALSHFDGLVAHTQYTRERLEGLNVPAANISEVPHGVLCHVPTTSVGEPPRDFASPNEFRLLFFGSIKHYKGLDILFDALSLLPEAIRSQIRVKVAGKPEQPERDVRRLAADYGIEAMIDWQLRFFRDDEVDGLFRASDAVVFPYRRIDASGALMTALPYRKVIIASELGQFDELLKDRTSAMLVRPADPDQLATAIQEVVRQPELRSRLAAGVGEVVQSIPNWDTIARRTVEFYRQRIIV
jgi:glycosyltransferase involved in cell wall biosynthesis